MRNFRLSNPKSRTMPSKDLKDYGNKRMNDAAAALVEAGWQYEASSTMWRCGILTFADVDLRRSPGEAEELAVLSAAKRRLEALRSATLSSIDEIRDLIDGGKVPHVRVEKVLSKLSEEVRS